MHCGASVGGGGGSKFFFFFFLLEKVLSLTCQTNAFHTKHRKPKLLALINSTLLLRWCTPPVLFCLVLRINQDKKIIINK